MTPRVLILAVLSVAAAAPLATAQLESPYAADLRFVDELRKRGDTALAMDYLLKLSKIPSPELAKELPFEMAKTRLVVGTEEPESSKRLALYQQARGEFETFLAQNPNSPRAGEARLEIAHVAVLQSKTQLSKALSQDTLQGRVTEGLVARKLFLDAGKQLDTAYTDLGEQYLKTPDADKARRKKLEGDLLQAELSKALNLFDVSQTYLNTGSNEELRARGDVLENASAALETLAKKDNGSIGWQATAWLARCQQLLGSPKDARKTLTNLLSIKVTSASAAALADAHRIGLYFLMLINRENPEPMDKEPVVTAVNAARYWLREYPRQRHTPEGYGVRFFLAENLLALAENPPKKMALDKAKTLQEARDLLKDIEHSENDFTDRARLLTISLIDQQGGFKTDIAQLKTFEECYLRSQYEISMISKDLKGVTDLKEREAKVKARREAAMKALELGLARPDAKPNAQGKFSFDINNARLALAYHYLNNGRTKDAIKTAEELARQDIRASQAPMAAAYAMQAYAQYLAEREQKVGPDELKPDRDKLLEFAKFAEEAWPNELPANLAREQVGMMLLREKKLAEAIQKMNTITPTYPRFALVKYEIANNCLAAEKAMAKPLEGLGSYADLAMKALTSIPDNSLGSADPNINYVYFLSRITIGQELYKAKKYAEMEKLAAPLLPKVETCRLDLDDARNTQRQKDITASLKNVIVYGKFGQADTETKAKNYPKVLELLMPIVAQINEGKQDQLKANPPFSTGMLGMALKATVAVNNLDQTKAVLAAMQKVGGDSDGVQNTLLQLVDLIQNQTDELTQSKDEAGLAKAKRSFKHILDEVDKAQTKKSMEFNYLLAKNYSNLDLHEKAADVLERVELPAKTGMKEADEKNERVYHTVRAAFIRELRLSGDKNRAGEQLKQTLTDGKPGWGLSNVDVQLEQVCLLEEDGKFGNGAKLADQWVKKLKEKADSDVQVREKYLEFYYHTAYCYYKYGVGMKEKGDKVKGDRAIKEAATQLVQLEKTYKGFGTDASTRRITELFVKEPNLKAQFEALKK